MSVARISLKHLRAFGEVAHHRHFTRAANALAMSQPALSAIIAQLEEDLDAQLLVRTTRSVELTPAGREFLQSSTRILSEVENAIQDVRDRAQLRRGKLRIAALPSVCMTLLPDLAKQFATEFKDISISITDAQGDEVVDLVARRQVEFGIGYVTPNDATIAEPVLQDRLEAVASRKIFKSPPKQMRWRDLEHYDIIAMTHGTTIRHLIDEAARRSGANLRIALQPNQMPTATAFAAAGLGIAVLPTFGIPSAPGSELIRIPLTHPVVERPLSIIRSPNTIDSPAAAAFLQRLRNTARRRQPAKRAPQTRA